MQQIDEAKIITNVLYGNINEFELLINEYGDKIYGYTFNMVKDKELTEEIIQTAFVKAYENLHKFNRSKPFMPWIMSITRNCIMDYYRKSSYRGKAILEENIITEIAADKYFQPEEVLQRKESYKEIDKILNSLPEKYRELIVLKYVQEQGYKEISNTLNIPIEKVKWRLHQARKRFVKEYEKINIIEGRKIYGMQQS